MIRPKFRIQDHKSNLAHLSSTCILKHTFTLFKSKPPWLSYISSALLSGTKWSQFDIACMQTSYYTCSERTFLVIWQASILIVRENGSHRGFRTPRNKHSTPKGPLDEQVCQTCSSFEDHKRQMP